MVGIANDEQVFVGLAEVSHKPILGVVYVLKLVYHYVFKTASPLFAYFGNSIENVKGKNKQIVVIKSEAFFSPAKDNRKR